MLKTEFMQGTHLEEAAELVIHRYKNLCDLEPLLPERYQERSSILSLLEDMLKADCPGVVAIRNRKLVGFMAGWLMPEFRGNRSTYSPEWANAAIMEESDFIYGELYKEIASLWLKEKYSAHYMSIFANDAKAVKAIQWLGFGMLSIDALRGLEPVAKSGLEIQVIQATAENHQDLIMLNQELRDYMTSSPIFFIPDTLSDEYLLEWLENPIKDVWMAYQDQEPIAFIRSGPANGDVCTIIFDEKTTSIYGAYTREARRRQDVGTSLLAKMLDSALKKGYSRCAVDFETMNLLATRFWLRHFTPVCYSLVRYIDQRILHS